MQRTRITVMQRIVIAAALAAGLAPALAHAADTRTASDHAGRCLAQVPASWVPGQYGLGMQSADGHETVAIAGAPGGFDQVKQVAQSTFTVTDTIEDSPFHYFVAIADRAGRPLKHLYIAVPAGSVVCTLTIDYDSALSDDDARAIALSLKGR